MAYEIEKRIYPKGITTRFGHVIIVPKGFDYQKPVTVLCLFHGIGERGDGSEEALKKMVNWGGWYSPENPSIFGSVGINPLVIVMVQTDSDFNKGEIDFSMSVASDSFIEMGVVALGLSLGGFGLINYGDSRNMANTFDKMMFVMPGGNGNIGKSFARNVVEAGIPCRFFHAKDDTLALPAQSIMLNQNIGSLGGDSELYLYEKGGHNIAGLPFNSYFPWKSYNDTTAKLVAGSDVPDESIYSWLIDGAPVEDKLLLTQQVWQKSNGIIYTKTI